MKDNLLITLGCSYTEGYGCYTPADYKILENVSNIHAFRNSAEFREIQERNIERFHELGWPNKLAKKLNYNKVLNISRGGASTSGILKTFIEKYENEKFSNSNVLVFWLLPESHRFSFYVDGKIKDYLITSEQPIAKEYAREITDHRLDPIYEQIFYVKLMQKICELNGWSFLFRSTSCENDGLLKDMLGSENQLIIDDNPNFLNLGEGLMSEICNHPNENGYDVISTKIYETIKQKFPHLLRNEIPISFESKWDGI